VVTIDCDACGTRLPMEKAKEALIQTGNNSYHLVDLCPSCLDDQLKKAQSVNDTVGYRQQAAALISLRAGEPLPSRS
jgi:hypothetical protein